jgi:hypothetical protein
MYYANVIRFSIRLIILFAIGFILSLLVAQQALSSMVIAPFKIVVDLDSSVGSQKNRNNRDNDENNTVKAIISYDLEEGCHLVNDPTNVTFSVLSDKMEAIDNVRALSIRYCDIDNNLIVQFDRDEITAYLQNLDIIGDTVHLSVIVEGTFIVTCSSEPAEEIEREVSEVSEIVVFGKRSRKKKLR